MKTTTVIAGTIGFDIGTKKRSAPKYRFNTTVEVPVVGTETIGCDEFARPRLIVLVEGKRISVPA